MYVLIVKVGLDIEVYYGDYDDAIKYGKDLMAEGYSVTLCPAKPIN